MEYPNLSLIFTTDGIITFLLNELALLQQVPAVSKLDTNANKDTLASPITFQLDCSKCAVDYINEQINKSGLGKWVVLYAENSIIDVQIIPTRGVS